MNDDNPISLNELVVALTFPIIAPFRYISYEITATSSILVAQVNKLLVLVLLSGANVNTPGALLAMNGSIGTNGVGGYPLPRIIIFGAQFIF